MKVVVAFDSFKGCMGSVAAGEAARMGVLDACPDADVDMICMADGGEGTLEAIYHSFNPHGSLEPERYEGCKFVYADSHDALMRPVNSRFVWDKSKRSACVELAQSAGLTLLKDNERHVLTTSTYGLGECISHALGMGAESITCALGGSATNDLGLGALQALGLRVFGSDGEIKHPVTGSDLIDISGFDASSLNPDISNCSFSFMYDADIPLTGPYGAVRMYARQKGADCDALKLLEKGTAHTAEIIKVTTGFDASDIKGSGAAGGTGFGLAAFLKAVAVGGADKILDLSDFDSRIKDADIILTGEGRSDSQTLQGKCAETVRRRAANYNIPVALLAGGISDRQILVDAGFCEVIDINHDMTTVGNPLLETVASSRLRLAVYNLLKHRIINRNFVNLH